MSSPCDLCKDGDWSLSLQAVRYKALHLKMPAVNHTLFCSLHANLLLDRLPFQTGNVQNFSYQYDTTKSATTLGRLGDGGRGGTFGGESSMPFYFKAFENLFELFQTCLLAPTIFPLPSFPGVEWPADGEECRHISGFGSNTKHAFNRLDAF